MDRAAFKAAVASRGATPRENSQAPSRAGKVASSLFIKEEEDDEYEPALHLTPLPSIEDENIPPKPASTGASPVTANGQLPKPKSTSTKKARGLNPVTPLTRPIAAHAPTSGSAPIGSTQPRALPGNIYAGLTSAKKRRRSTSPATAAARPHATRPHAPPKKPLKSVKPQYSDIEVVNTRTTSRSSEWYETIDMHKKYSRTDLVSLEAITGLIEKCRRESERGRNLDNAFAAVRHKLHQMEFFDFLSGVIVKKSKVLDDRSGLPRIFDDPDNINYPWDIKLDAEALFIRWMQGDLDTHLLRGIETSNKKRANGKTAMGHSLQKDYAARRSCNVVGDNGLVNGQWWPMQICAMRDGAHGEIEAGIHGQHGKGALSVLLSSGAYDDKDEGDRILYCGTSGSEGKPTTGTKYMKESERLRIPVRVLRSSALPQSNGYRPSRGLRYDGVYDIVDSEILDVDTAMHRFTLQRQEGQTPIRCSGEENRPTPFEIAAYTKIRHLLGLKS
ncbi:MAG: hypothetical protein M1825_000473 [Sarcosagium campestre]|nr:MAG: hypothetical protein M1825_000473 [Sarcosagium campestre]